MLKVSQGSPSPTAKETVMLSSLLRTALMLTQTCLAQAGDGFSQETIAEVHARLAPAICVVTYASEVSNPQSGKSTKRAGSAPGLLVSPTGLLMASGHMQVENSEPFNITVAVGQGDEEKEYSARLLKKPDDVNVCLLQLESETPLSGLPYAQFATGVELKVGTPLLALGVLSEPLDHARSTLTCRVGAILDKPRTTYCLDQSVRFGFVGGPVADAQSRVIGVIGFDLTPNEGGDLYVRSGHPLVYQASLFRKYIDAPPGERIASADEEHAWLGVFTQPLNDDLAEYWGLKDNGGLVISTLVPGAPAEQVGLRRGDVIKDFDGTPIRAKQNREVRGFTKLVREAGIGNTVTIKLLRDGEPIEVEVTLGSRPKSARDAGEYEDPIFGVTVREITTDVRILLNLADDVQGVIVRSIKSGGAAALAKMRPGIIIMNLGDFPITSLDDFRQAAGKIAADKPTEVTAFCRAGSATGFFRLEPRW